MAEGIRIRHSTLKGVTLALRDMTERIDPPYPVCSLCTLDMSEPSTHVSHDGYKTRHFRLDSDGYTIVSEGMLEALKRHVDLGGFAIEGIVKDPPKQRISFGADGQVTSEVIHKVPRPIITKGKS